jgi:hypothetical protein
LEKFEQELKLIPKFRTVATLGSITPASSKLLSEASVTLLVIINHLDFSVDMGSC